MWEMYSWLHLIFWALFKETEMLLEIQWDLIRIKIKLRVLHTMLRLGHMSGSTDKRTKYQIKQTCSQDIEEHMYRA